MGAGRAKVKTLRHARRGVAAAVVLLGVVAPATAHAASVFTVYSLYDTITYFDAAPGESNSLSVVSDPVGYQLVFHDTGAPVVAGSNCTQHGPSTAICIGRITSVRLGDGNDRVWLGGDARGYVQGGPGADKLVGGVEDDLLDGEDGPDVLVGNRGHDTLVGGPGNDRVEAFDGAADYVDCGLGMDMLVADPKDKPRYGCEGLLSR